MEANALGTYDIKVSIIGHNTEEHAIVIQLPTGVIVNAVVSKTNFANHMQPLIENPPPPPPAFVPRNETKSDDNHIPIQPKQEEQSLLPQKVEDLWYDPMAMFDDIKFHAWTNGRAIIPDERPNTNRLAWKCQNTGKTWSVEISCIKETLDALAVSPNPQDQSKSLNIRKCIWTIEGRERLCAFFNAYQ